VRPRGGRAEGERDAVKPFALGWVIFAVASAVTAGALLTLSISALHDWRAFFVFLLLPAITVAVLLVAALKH
jgi:predicted MFS family arabinose efflux permease